MAVTLVLTSVNRYLMRRSELAEMRTLQIRRETMRPINVGRILCRQPFRGIDDTGSARTNNTCTSSSAPSPYVRRRQQIGERLVTALSGMRRYRALATHTHEL